MTGRSYRELIEDTHRGREIECLNAAIERVEDGEIADLKAKLAEARKWVRAKRREVAELDAQARYDAYVDCVTCFPYRDFAEAAEAGGVHTCGLDATQRSEIRRKYFD